MRASCVFRAWSKRATDRHVGPVGSLRFFLPTVGPTQKGLSRDETRISVRFPVKRRDKQKPCCLEFAVVPRMFNSLSLSLSFSLFRCLSFSLSLSLFLLYLVGFQEFVFSSPSVIECELINHLCSFSTFSRATIIFRVLFARFAFWRPPIVFPREGSSTEHEIDAILSFHTDSGNFPFKCDYNSSE